MESNNNNSWLLGLVKPNLAAQTVTKVSGIPMPVLCDYLRMTNISGYTQISFDKIAVPRRFRIDKAGSLIFRKDGQPSISTVKEIAQAGRTIITNLVAGMVESNTQFKDANPDKWTDHLAAEEESAQLVLETEQRVLQAGLDRRAAEIAAAEAALKAEVDAAISETAPEDRVPRRRNRSGAAHQETAPEDARVLVPA